MWDAANDHIAFADGRSRVGKSTRVGRLRLRPVTVGMFSLWLAFRHFPDECLVVLTQHPARARKLLSRRGLSYRWEVFKNKVKLLFSKLTLEDLFSGILAHLDTGKGPETASSGKAIDEGELPGSSQGTLLEIRLQKELGYTRAELDDLLLSEANYKLAALNELASGDRLVGIPGKQILGILGSVKK